MVTLGQALGVNVKGYAYGMKHSIPVMAATGGGSIVNLASISSWVAQPAFVPYNTTKGAILVHQTHIFRSFQLLVLGLLTS